MARSQLIEEVGGTVEWAKDKLEAFVGLCLLVSDFQREAVLTPVYLTPA